jgi:hypothetical protein
MEMDDMDGMHDMDGMQQMDDMENMDYGDESNQMVSF